MKKTMDEKIHRDAEALADDIRRVRNDLVGLLSPARRRAHQRVEQRWAAIMDGIAPAPSSPDTVASWPRPVALASTFIGYVLLSEVGFGLAGQAAS